MSAPEFQLKKPITHLLLFSHSWYSPFLSKRLVKLYDVGQAERKSVMSYTKMTSATHHIIILLQDKINDKYQFILLGLSRGRNHLSLSFVL